MSEHTENVKIETSTPQTAAQAAGDVYKRQSFWRQQMYS